MTIWTPDALDPKQPKYLALADAISQAVSAGELQPGSRLPPQRQLADRLHVTIGTITRAYAEAERRGLLEARVGSGTYVRQRSQAESFRIEHPDTNTLDLGFTLALQDSQADTLAEALQSISQNPALLAELTSFVPETGLDRHREAASRWLHRSEGITRRPQDILINGGGQNGLFTALHTLCDTGDTVLSDGLTYSGFILAARHLRLRHIGLPMDEEGLIPTELQTACDRHRPRALYLMPQLHNPTGVQMSQRRKQEILTICARYQVMVIEDNVQSALLEHSPEPMVSMAPDQVTNISGVSKCFAGGPRVGFLIPPPHWYDRFRMALRVNSWMVSPLLAELVTRWLDHPDTPTSLQRQRTMSSQRHAMARDILHGYQYAAHDHSLSGWLMLPEHWRGNDLVAAMAHQGVAIKSADVFAVGQYAAPQAVRICIGAPATEDSLQQALVRLRDTLTRPGADQQWLRDCTI